ncbi:choice-of-anchor J domain-containing protein [Marinicella litoralis]|uniref:Secreted protein n=1 Tax=Marinicella litoralis TaxID=644220 RepID=A0A4R6XYA9_9GAMM|nr:choice-of-anchor J domain-containing protein [Marinicella litoralis]TDR23284.1 hypothetical protein C8D91_0144 [Marinicella litoralis]
MKSSIYLTILLLLLSAPLSAGSYSEGFEAVNQLPGDGWVFDNQSDFIGDLSWGQGFASVFPAQAGSDNSYILGGVGQTGGNILCDWLILPDIGMVEQLNFFTRTVPNSPSADNLLVAYSPSGGINTGPCVGGQPAFNGTAGSDFGDFQILLSINPNLTAGTYPEQWTEFNVPVNGAGRLALIYFVENVGQSPFNGNLIGIDSISVGPITPINQGTPTSVPGLNTIGVILLMVVMLLLLAVTPFKSNN